MPRIFVSYRRKSWPFTHRLAEELNQRLDAEIFVDFSGIDETDFEHAILRNLRESDAVLLVISEHTFMDRIHRDDDWVRREIREALILGKPLILVCVEGLLPPPGLPDDIKDVARMQGINFYPEYFTSAVDRLVEFVAKVGAARPRTIPESAPPVTPASDEKSIGGRVTLDESLDLLQAGDFHKAIFLLESLQQAGYTSRYVNITGVLEQARQDAEQADRRRQAALDYDEIASFARRKVTEDHAQTAFDAWCDDYPDLVDDLDTENLRARFGAALPSELPESSALLLEKTETPHAQPVIASRKPRSQPKREIKSSSVSQPQVQPVIPPRKRHQPLPVVNVLPPPFAWIEIPAGRVTIENVPGAFEVPAFAIARYPITNAQYQVFMEANNGYQKARWWDYSPEAKSWREQHPRHAPGRFAGDKRPRETVSWYEAVAFCRWLSHLSGQVITLPSERQWQWAAQGRDGRAYPWGKEFDSEKCNTGENGNGQTTDVDHYPQGASPFGVMDMGGNVWEWCLTEYDNLANIGLNGSARRVVRGGSWYSSQDCTRAAYRHWDYPSDRDGNLGIRLVCIPQP